VSQVLKKICSKERESSSRFLGGNLLERRRFEVDKVCWLYTHTHTHTHIYILSWAKRIRHHGLGLKANKNMHKFMGC